jgi:hypothetical protein
MNAGTKKKVKGRTKRLSKHVKNYNHRKLMKSLTKRDRSKCAPNNNDNDYSCFSKEGLLKIIKAWNSEYPHNKIGYKDSNSLVVLWKKLDRKLKKTCTNEWCWSEQKFVKSYTDDKVKKFTFKPKQPKKWTENHREWLTTSDIENVLKQYTKKHKDFVFVGPVPIDFDKKYGPGYCIVDELCKINLNNLLKRKKNRLGVVFNLDAHDEPGSHWVAMFADFYKNEIYYWDSYGTTAPEEVHVLMNRLKSQGAELGRNIKIKVNNVRHQYKNSECGVYCIHFIVKLLEGGKYPELITKKIDDDTMETNRDHFFIKH